MLALSRVYFTLGGFGGPEKDQILRFVGEVVSLGSLSSHSLRQLHVLRHNSHSFSVYST